VPSKETLVSAVRVKMATATKEGSEVMFEHGCIVNYIVRYIKKNIFCPVALVGFNPVVEAAVSAACHLFRNPGLTNRPPRPLADRSSK
jgi:hypothetical protein